MVEHEEIIEKVNWCNKQVLRRRDTGIPMVVLSVGAENVRHTRLRLLALDCGAERNKRETQRKYLEQGKPSCPASGRRKKSEELHESQGRRTRPPF